MTRRFDRPGRSPVFAENGMAATSHPLATATALSVLREGGNAVDAALAASATLVVVEPHMTGVGGDCFVILAEPDGSVHGLNGSGRAPAAADAARLRAMGYRAVPEIGPHAVTVPGAVKAWEVLHARSGRFRWNTSLSMRSVMRRRATPSIRVSQPTGPTSPMNSQPTKARRGISSSTAGHLDLVPAMPFQRSVPHCERSPGTAPRPSTRARSAPRWLRLYKPREAS